MIIYTLCLVEITLMKHGKGKEVQRWRVIKNNCSFLCSLPEQNTHIVWRTIFRLHILCMCVLLYSNSNLHYFWPISKHLEYVQFPMKPVLASLGLADRNFKWGGSWNINEVEEESSSCLCSWEVFGVNIKKLKDTDSLALHDFPLLRRGVQVVRTDVRQMFSQRGNEKLDF